MAINDPKHQTELKLEQKYSKVISRAKELGAKIEKSHVENNKLVLVMAVPSEQAKSIIWDQVKSVDSAFSDLSLQARVDSQLQGTGSSQSAGQQTYVVQQGDTLSEISQRFYGNAGQYMKIFNANKNTLNDPDKIKAGQTLVIPE